jgi:hypothetical protein
MDSRRCGLAVSKAFTETKKGTVTVTLPAAEEP